MRRVAGIGHVFPRLAGCSILSILPQAAHAQETDDRDAGGLPILRSGLEIWSLLPMPNRAEPFRVSRVTNTDFDRLPRLTCSINRPDHTCSTLVVAVTTMLDTLLDALLDNRLHALLDAERQSLTPRVQLSPAAIIADVPAVPTWPAVRPAAVRLEAGFRRTTGPFPLPVGLFRGESVAPGETNRPRCVQVGFNDPP